MSDPTPLSTPAAQGTELHFVFDDFPNPEGARFIEVEDGSGRSVSAGEWRRREDGLVELVVPMGKDWSYAFDGSALRDRFGGSFMATEPDINGNVAVLLSQVDAHAIIAALSASTSPEALPASAVEAACTDCGDTGITFQTERRCACQPHDHQAAVVEAIASWLERQRPETPARGWEFAAALRAGGPDLAVIATSPAPGGAPAVVDVETVLAAYEAETRKLPLGAASREKGDSAYNWRMSVVKDLRELAARINSTKQRQGLGEMIYRALYEHEGGIWDAVDDRYKETVWNAAGRRLARALTSAPAPEDRSRKTCCDSEGQPCARCLEAALAYTRKEPRP